MCSWSSNDHNEIFESGPCETDSWSGSFPSHTCSIGFSFCHCSQIELNKALNCPQKGAFSSTFLCSYAVQSCDVTRPLEGAADSAGTDAPSAGAAGLTERHLWWWCFSPPNPPSVGLQLVVRGSQGNTYNPIMHQVNWLSQLQSIS